MASGCRPHYSDEACEGCAPELLSPACPVCYEDPADCTCEEEETEQVKAETMSELVYGRRERRATRVERWQIAAIFFLFVVASMLGCATTHPVVVTVEAPGELAPSYHSIAVAPVHADTDLSVAYQAVDSDVDAGPAAPALDAEAAPEVQAKASHGF